MSLAIHITDILTITNKEEKPPPLCILTKHHHQKQIEHDTFTQHPTEGREEEIVEQCCYEGTESLKKSTKKKIKTKITFSSIPNSFNFVSCSTYTNYCSYKLYRLSLTRCHAITSRAAPIYVHILDSIYLIFSLGVNLLEFL